MSLNKDSPALQKLLNKERRKNEKLQNELTISSAEKSQSIKQVKSLTTALKSHKTPRGRNKMKKESYDGFMFANNDIIAKFCRHIVFPHLKFLHPSWAEYTPDDRTSLCIKLLDELDWPEDCDIEYYWHDKIVPLFNKCYCDSRSGAHNVVRICYQCKWRSYLS